MGTHICILYFSHKEIRKVNRGCAPVCIENINTGLAYCTSLWVLLVTSFSSLVLCLFFLNFLILFFLNNIFKFISSSYYISNETKLCVVCLDKNFNSCEDRTA